MNILLKNTQKYTRIWKHQKKKTFSPRPCVFSYFLNSFQGERVEKTVRVCHDLDMLMPLVLWLQIYGSLPFWFVRNSEETEVQPLLLRPLSNLRPFIDPVRPLINVLYAHTISKFAAFQRNCSNTAGYQRCTRGVNSNCVESNQCSVTQPALA